LIEKKKGTRTGALGAKEKEGREHETDKAQPGRKVIASQKKENWKNRSLRKNTKREKDQASASKK